MRPRGNLNLPRSTTDFVKGLNSTIPYVVRNPSGDWSNFFDADSWIEQKYNGNETDCCWLFSAVDEFEEQLEWLHTNNQFSAEALTFFTSNGYFDAQGHFDLSRRFLACLSGVKNNGNSQIVAWQLLKEYGIIPLSMLDYVSNDATYQDFVNNYFDVSCITPAMTALGKQFLQYVSVAYEWIGDGVHTPSLTEFNAILLQSPQQIGIPTPVDIELWNAPVVQYDGSTIVEHAVTLLAINADGSYKILDQYNPCIKILSANYLIPMVTNGVLTAIPVPQNPISQSAPVPSWWRKILASFGI